MAHKVEVVVSGAVKTVPDGGSNVAIDEAIDIPDLKGGQSAQ